MNQDAIAESTPYKGPSWGFDMAGWPLHWLRKAQELNRAAEILFETVQDDFLAVRTLVNEMQKNPEMELTTGPPSVLDVYMFLVALALEVSLKGLYVRSHPECIENGKFRKGINTSHKLLCLAKAVGITLTNEEKTLLEFGTSAIESWGRYPIPKHKDALQSQRMINLRIADVYSALFKRVTDDLEKNPLPTKSPP
jgi:hypothetical protein